MTLFKKGSSEIMHANIPRKLTTHDSESRFIKIPGREGWLIVINSQDNYQSIAKK